MKKFIFVAFLTTTAMFAQKAEQSTTDSRGRTTSTTIREYEAFNVAGDEVRRLIAIDGKPLSGNEKKKEDERFNKEFEKGTKAEAEAARNPKKQQKQEEKDEAQISDFLRAVHFNNARRERFRGQDVIAAGLLSFRSEFWHAASLLKLQNEHSFSFDSFAAI